jgi:hypothetical protein
MCADQENSKQQGEQAGTSTGQRNHFFDWRLSLEEKKTDSVDAFPQPHNRLLPAFLRIRPLKNDAIC